MRRETKPPPCPACGAEPTLRKQCSACGTSVWAIQHTEHYPGGGREVIPCRCSTMDSKEADKLRKHRDMRGRTGKGIGPPPPRHTTTEMARKAAEGLARGLTIKQAMLNAGFPQTMAHHGRQSLNRTIRSELAKLGHTYIKLGKELSPEDQEAMVRGRLAMNVIQGTDKGVLSAKQLGADKRIAMWQPDSQVGMVVLQAPPVPVIDHEVPLFPVEQPPEEPKVISAKTEHDVEPEETPFDPEPQENHENDEYEEEEKKHSRD